MDNIKFRINAELIAVECRRFTQLTAEGHSATQAARALKRPLNWFNGVDSYLAKFHSGQPLVAALGAPARQSAANSEFVLPPWFIPAAKFIYLWTNNRRAGGSVTEAVLRVASFPEMKFGCNRDHVNRLIKHLNRKGVWDGHDLPTCPPELRGTIFQRHKAGRALVPRSIARKIIVPAAVMQKFRSPRAFALDTLSAPGSHHLGPGGMNLLINLIDETLIVPVILCIPKLLKRLSNSNYEEAAQLFGNRLCECVTLPSPPADEIGEMLAERGVKFDNAETRSAATLKLKEESPMHGNWRFVSQVTRECRLKMNGGPLTLSQFSAALSVCRDRRIKQQKN